MNNWITEWSEACRIYCAWFRAFRLAGWMLAEPAGFSFPVFDSVAVLLRIENRGRFRERLGGTAGYDRRRPWRLLVLPASGNSFGIAVDGGWAGFCIG